MIPRRHRRSSGSLLAYLLMLAVVVMPLRAFAYLPSPDGQGTVAAGHHCTQMDTDDASGPRPVSMSTAITGHHCTDMACHCKSCNDHCCHGGIVLFPASHDPESSPAMEDYRRESIPALHGISVPPFETPPIATLR